MMSSDPCAKTALYYDGELPPEEEAAVLEHLATCEKCQGQLGDFLQLDAAVSRATVEKVAAQVSSIAAARKKRAPLLVGGLAVALAAAAALVLVLRRTPEPVTIALAETRSVEVRLASSELDQFRPYRVERSSSQPGEVVSLQTMAELERRGSPRQVAEAYLVSGDPTRARALLAKLPDSPERDSDLAAAALLAREPETALELADRALAASPTLPQAHWNRALALRDLGLPLAAAAAFERAAELGDPRWAAEGRERAAQLTTPYQKRRAELERITKAAALARLEVDPPFPLADVPRAPGQARLYFARATRMALGAEDLAGLAPLAKALDALPGTWRFTATLEKLRAADFTARRPLALAYRELVAGKLAPADKERFVADARAAGAWDLYLVALYLSGQFPAAGAEPEAIAARWGDPYLQRLVRTWQGLRRHHLGRLAPAEESLTAALAGCADSWVYECLDVERYLVEVLAAQQRVPAAQEHVLHAWQRVETDGEQGLANALTWPAAESFALGGRGAMARAFIAEGLLRQPDDCARRALLETVAADVAYYARDFVTLRQTLRQQVGCPVPLHPQLVNLRLNVARMTRDPGDVAAATTAIDLYQQQARTEGGLAAAQVFRGALTTLRDPDAGAAQLRAAIATLRSLPREQRDFITVIPIGFEALIASAAARGDYAGALRDFEDEAGVTLPSTCAIAASGDDDRGVALVRGRDGVLRGQLARAPGLIWRDVSAIVPAELRRSLDGCDEVSVLARPPLHGRPDLLPPDLAWSFLSPSGEERPEPTASPRALLVTDVVPPPALSLPRLAAHPASRSTDVVVAGPEATPTRVLAELSRATYVELHAHGLANLAVSDASFLALSPDRDGRYALTAGDLADVELAGSPTVVLAACRAAEVAPYFHERWSLPDAFVRAGARTVIAATVAIPDDGAAQLFAALRARLEKGEPAARALRDERQAWLGRGESWVGSVIVFRAR
jgi:cellulose synthase operon protein C